MAAVRRAALNSDFRTGEEVIKEIRDKTDTILLSFSCGKDSVGCYLGIKDKFPRIIPFFFYLVPGLSFAERSLTYYERIIGAKIIRVPHPSLYRMLNNCVFQTPERVRVIKRMDLQSFDYDDVENALRRDCDCPNAWVATGVRMSDSLQRRQAIRQYGSINNKRRHFFPIFDWTKERLMLEIKKSSIRLSEEYRRVT